MNFPPFGGHFPGTIPSIHQFTAEGSGGASAARYANHFPNQPPIGVPNLGKYRPEANNIQSQPQSIISNKSPYPNSNVHHYSNVPYSQAQSVPQRSSTNSSSIQEKRSYHQVNKLSFRIQIFRTFY